MYLRSAFLDPLSEQRWDYLSAKRNVGTLCLRNFETLDRRSGGILCQRPNIDLYRYYMVGLPIGAAIGLFVSVEVRLFIFAAL